MWMVDALALMVDALALMVETQLIKYILGRTVVVLVDLLTGNFLKLCCSLRHLAIKLNTSSVTAAPAVRHAPREGAYKRDEDKKSPPKRAFLSVPRRPKSSKHKRQALNQRLFSGGTSRRTEPVNSWRGRPILYSGSPIISFSWAIQPTVRARLKMPVNRFTGMPMARCTMPE